MRRDPINPGLAHASGAGTNETMSIEVCDALPVLDTLSGVRAAFFTRIPGVDAAVDREEALARLQPTHDALITELGFSRPSLAEQVHGHGVAIVSTPGFSAGADALVTATPGLTLGIYVADCAAIYVVDPVRRAIGLAHSGRKGTEANILGHTVALMHEHFGADPADLVVAVSPCIRPPNYEVDFAAEIAAQAHAAGVGTFHDAGVCTAASIDRYYSYRREMGKTGRMLALLMLEP
jgi:polyphenol oxidase